MKLTHAPLLATMLAACTNNCTVGMNEWPMPVEFGEYCPPDTPASDECRADDVSEDCRTLWPGHNTFDENRLNIVFRARDMEQDELYGVARSEVSQLMTEDFFGGNITQFNFWYTTGSLPGIPLRSLDTPSDRDTDPVFACERDIQQSVDDDLAMRTSTVYVTYDGKKNDPNAGRNNTFDVFDFSDDSLLNIVEARDIVRETLASEGYEDHHCKDLTGCDNNPYAVGCEIESIIQESIAVDTNHPYYSVRVSELVCSLLWTNSSIDLSAEEHMGGDVLANLLGHGTFGFYQEFSWPFRDSHGDHETFPMNCFPADSREECEANAPWSDRIGTVHRGQEIGCYSGCDYSEKNFRATRKGIMHYDAFTLWDSGSSHLEHGFGLPNEEHACRVLSVMNDRATDYCTDLVPELVIFNE